MKRQDANSKYKWDFSYLYNSKQEWSNDLLKAKNLITQIAKLKGKLNLETIFLKYLDLDYKLDILLTKLTTYLHLLDLDLTNTSLQKMSAIFENELTALMPKISFINAELKKVGKEKIFLWISKDKKLSQYNYGFRRFFKNVNHICDEKVSKLLSEVSKSRSIVYSAYNLLAFADRKMPKIIYKNKNQELTLTLYNDIMENSDPIKDQQLRINASKKINYNLIANKHTFAKIYEGIVFNNIENAKINHYNSAIEAALNSDDVNLSVYKDLIKVGKKYSNLFIDYCNIIKNHFQFKNFYQTDRNLKLVKSYKKKYSVSEAKTIIKKALQPLGAKYLKFLEIAWSANKIDYFEDTNKRTGAYSAGGSGFDPIILMNWDNSVGSINTLAHEIGHSVHTLIAQKYQPYELAKYPIILAEVASTVNEHLLFDYLYKNSNDNQEKIYLLQNRILDIINTFFRQIQFADFEMQAYDLAGLNKPLDARSLCNLFSKISNDFGYSVFDKNLDNKPYSWTRISHFFNSPFYVYKYATCIVASFKLFNDIKNNKPENLINFLKQGGCKEPLAILKDAGINYNILDNYLDLINKLKKMINNLKLLLNQ